MRREQGFLLLISCTASLIHKNLNSQGRKRMKGMSLDALKRDYGLGPVSYEVKVDI